MSVAPLLPGGLRDALVDVARVRLGLVQTETVDVLPYYADELDGFWRVPLFQGDRGRVVVIMATGGEIAAHAGLSRAAARLRDIDLFGRDHGWAIQNLRPLLDAVGGLSPASPRYPTMTCSWREDGGLRMAFAEPASWVQFAAGGALGPAPPVAFGEGGIEPPEHRGQMICELSPAYDLSWEYEVDGLVLSSFAGAPADDRPDALPAVRAEKIIAAARAALGSPYATPAAPVTPTGDDGGAPWRVELLGGGAFEVAEPDRS